MKQVIFKLKNPETIDFTNIGTHSVIGFADKRYPTKGWVQCNNFNYDEFKLMCVDKGVSNGNCWGFNTKTIFTMKEALIFLRDGGYKVFLFDNEKELFAWLAKDFIT